MYALHKKNMFCSSNCVTFVIWLYSFLFWKNRVLVRSIRDHIEVSRWGVSRTKFHCKATEDLNALEMSLAPQAPATMTNQTGYEHTRAPLWFSCCCSSSHFVLVNFRLIFNYFCISLWSLFDYFVRTSIGTPKSNQHVENKGHDVSGRTQLLRSGAREKDYPIGEDGYLALELFLRGTMVPMRVLICGGKCFLLPMKSRV